MLDCPSREMISIPNFSSPFPKWTALGSSSSSARKRKRDESEDDQDDETLFPVEDYQHGPHAPRPPIEKSNKVLSQTKLGVALSRLKPPVYNLHGHITNLSFDQPSDSSSSRQHLNVVTTIMHKCLLEGDYIRAGRALGMLLRAELNGHPFDIRTHDRWGVGAEILYRRDAQAYKSRSCCPRQSLDAEAGNLEESTLQRDIEFSKMGIEKAKSYYEALVLHYPYRKTMPHASSSLHFYPAMLGLWIHSVEEQQKAELSCTLTRNSEQVGNEDKETRSSVETITSPEYTIALQGRVRLSTLQEARKINAQLDELLLSPPYVDDVFLWKLKGSVSLWLGDLCVPLELLSKFQDDNERESTLEERYEDDDCFDQRISAAGHRVEYHGGLELKEAHVKEGKKAYETAEYLRSRVREKVGKEWHI